MDEQAWRVARGLVLKLLVLEATVACARLAFDPTLVASLRAVAEKHPLDGDGFLYLVSSPIGAVLNALLTVSLMAWLPSKLSDLVHGQSMDARWGWGLVAASLPFLAWLADRALESHLFTSFPATAWWFLLVPVQVTVGCALWWLVRKHGFLTAWVAGAALELAGTAASLLVGWLVSGAGA